MITLSPERWKKYSSLYCLIENFQAIDSRDDSDSVLRNFGFDFDLVDWHCHFDRFSGAIGCFISHYLLWEYTSQQNDWVLILEDDVRVVDLDEFFRDYEIDDSYELIKLNKRPGSIGADAYLLHSSGAKKIIKLCNKKITRPVDRFLWENAIEELSWKHDQFIGLAGWCQESTLKK